MIPKVCNACGHDPELDSAEVRALRTAVKLAESALATARAEVAEAEVTLQEVVTETRANAIGEAAGIAEREAYKGTHPHGIALAVLALAHLPGQGDEVSDDTHEDLRALYEDARSQLAALTAERDALKAGKWAGRWQPSGDGQSERRYSAAHLPSAVLVPGVGVWLWCVMHERYATGEAPTADEAKAAADAALRADGWWLEGA